MQEGYVISIKNRERYLQRVADGFCPNCGRVNADKTHILCPDCRAYNVAYQKRRYAEMRAAGRCVTCGDPAGGKSRCPVCAARLSAMSREYYRQKGRRKTNDA